MTFGMSLVGPHLLFWCLGKGVFCESLIDLKKSALNMWNAYFGFTCVELIIYTFLDDLGRRHTTIHYDILISFNCCKDFIHDNICYLIS